MSGPVQLSAVGESSSNCDDSGLDSSSTESNPLTCTSHRPIQANSAWPSLHGWVDIVRRVKPAHLYIIQTHSGQLSLASPPLVGRHRPPSQTRSPVHHTDPPRPTQPGQPSVGSRHHKRLPSIQQPSHPCQLSLAILP